MTNLFHPCDGQSIVYPVADKLISAFNGKNPFAPYLNHIFCSAFHFIENLISVRIRIPYKASPNQQDFSPKPMKVLLLDFDDYIRPRTSMMP
jgi:hypothetical protein